MLDVCCFAVCFVRVASLWSPVVFNVSLAHAGCVLFYCFFCVLVALLSPGVCFSRFRLFMLDVWFCCLCCSCCVVVVACVCFLLV